jgi:hypothetical protein
MVRARALGLLAEFDAGLEDIQGRFVKPAVEHAEKRFRFMGAVTETKVNREEEEGMPPVSEGSVPLLG